MTAQTPLKRSLSLPLLVLYGLGTTIGAGIYVLVGEVAARAGLYAPASFLLAAVLAGLTAFSFAELSARFPRSAGEAVYIQEGLRAPRLALAAGLLVALAGTVSAGAITIGAAGYAADLLSLPKAPLIAVLIVSLGAVAAWGITQSALLVCGVTLLEILGLLVVVAVGLDALPEGLQRLAEAPPAPDGAALVGVLAGTLLAFFAFLGFEDMVNVAEEVKDVTHVLPLAIVLTLVFTTLVYLAVTAVAVLTVPIESLAASDAPMVLVYEHNGGWAPQVLATVAIFATLNGALIQIIMASRILYGLAGRAALPQALARVDETTRTPLRATGLVVALVLLLALLLPIDLLAEATSVITLGVFALVNAALIALKRRGLREASAFTVPLWLPVAGFLACVIVLGLELLRLLGAL